MAVHYCNLVSFSFKMAVTSRSSVPTFTPDLRVIPSMPHCEPFKELLLSKIINAERACYHAPKFFKLTVSVGLSTIARTGLYVLVLFVLC